MECPYEDICDLDDDDDKRDDTKESNGSSESNDSDGSDEWPFGDDDYCEDDEDDDDSRMTGYMSDDDVGDFDRRRREGTHVRKTDGSAGKNEMLSLWSVTSYTFIGEREEVVQWPCATVIRA